MDLSRFQKAPRITRTLDMGEFDEGYRGATFEVWVSPNRAHLDAWQDITAFIVGVNQRLDEMEVEEKEAAFAEWRERVVGWYAQTWGIEADVARQIRDALEESNPLGWKWLTRRTSAMIGEYRQEKLKN